MRKRILTTHVLTLLAVQLSTPSHAGGGYLAYCPCMGRFGNQADQFLGSLAFARGLGRTLILPPWIMYSATQGNVEFVAWDSVFNMTVLEEFHKVITMDEFM